MNAASVKFPSRPQVGENKIVETRALNAFFGDHQVLRNVSLNVRDCEAVALIGPSGCGKSTFLRCLNRLHEEVKGARSTGEVLLDGKNIYADGVDPVAVRAQVGMVFQKPNPFPSMSIQDNVLAGKILAGKHLKKSEEESLTRLCLEKVGLWKEVKDKLKRSGVSLSGGQQQRLCIARCLAIEPRILLMDEPTSALDPKSTAKIEELVRELRRDVTICIVTHNMQQAQRIADRTAFFYEGDLIEFGTTKEIFSSPKEKKTQEYVAGHFS